MQDNISNTVTVSDNVFRRVKFLIEKASNNDIALRVSVEGGGCSGFKYKYELTSAINEDDIEIEKDGAKIVVDQISAPFLQNSRLDYIEELGAAYFTIKNPNATSKCGCGSSFGV